MIEAAKVVAGKLSRRLQVRVLSGAPNNGYNWLFIFESMVSVAQLVEPRIVIPVVVGSSPIVHPNLNLWETFPSIAVAMHGKVLCARVAELVDALDLGSSGVTRESSSLSFRTRFPNNHDNSILSCS